MHVIRGRQITGNGANRTRVIVSLTVGFALITLAEKFLDGQTLASTSLQQKESAMTLVFAKEKTLAALVEGRTAVWYQDRVIGRREWLEPLFQECVKVAKPNLRGGKSALVEITNNSPVELKLRRTGSLGPAELTLPAQATVLVKIPTSDRKQLLELAYAVTNFLVAPDEGLPVVLRVPGP